MALFSNAEISVYAKTTVASDLYDLLHELVSGLVEAVDGNDYSTDTPTATAKAIGLEAAARVVRNPDGVSSKSEAIDDYSVTNRWEGLTADDIGPYLTDSEIARLRGVPRNRSVVLQVP